MTLPQPPSLCVGLLKPFFKVVVAQKGSSLSGKKKTTKTTTTTFNTTTTTTTTTPNAKSATQGVREKEKGGNKKGRWDLFTEGNFFVWPLKGCVLMKPGIIIGETFRRSLCLRVEKGGPYFFEVLKVGIKSWRRVQKRDTQKRGRQ